jgi:hypothetical protein
MQDPTDEKTRRTGKPGRIPKSKDTGPRTDAALSLLRGTIAERMV